MINAYTFARWIDAVDTICQHPCLRLWCTWICTSTVKTTFLMDTLSCMWQNNNTDELTISTNKAGARTQKFGRRGEGTRIVSQTGLPGDAHVGESGGRSTRRQRQSVSFSQKNTVRGERTWWRRTQQMADSCRKFPGEVCVYGGVGGGGKRTAVVPSSKASRVGGQRQPAGTW